MFHSKIIDEAKQREENTRNEQVLKIFTLLWYEEVTSFLLKAVCLRGTLRKFTS